MSTGRRAAFLVVPHAGGTYTVFTSMRAALAGLGIELRWVGFSDDCDKVMREYPGEMGRGELIDARGKTETEIGKELVRVLNGGYEIVFINVLTTVAEMSAAAYLPAGVKRVMIAHNITRGTYDGAKLVKPFAEAAVGVCERIRSELVGLGFPEAGSFCVPNAMDVGPYEGLVRNESVDGEFRILSLGRVVDADKGVLWLPEVLRRLKGKKYTLTVAGDGPDLGELKKRCVEFGERVKFLGKVLPSAVPGLMEGHDVLLMPSRYEGFGYTLIEAMAGGCVPVATRIKGVTDFVVKEGETGMLFEMGDVARAAGAIEALAGDVGMRGRMQAAGVADVQARFTVGAMAEAYGPVLRHLEAAVPAGRIVGEFRLLKMGGGWRRFVPVGVKNWLRRRMYR